MPSVDALSSRIQTARAALEPYPSPSQVAADLKLRLAERAADDGDSKEAGRHLVAAMWLVKRSLPADCKAVKAIHDAYELVVDDLWVRREDAALGEVRRLFVAGSVAL